jgi:hypothetical protein
MATDKVTGFLKGWIFQSRYWFFGVLMILIGMGLMILNQSFVIVDYFGLLLLLWV